MEEVLTHLARDASAPKMGALRQSCEAALGGCYVDVCPVAVK